MTVMAGAAAVAHLFTFEDEMVGADVKATALDNEFYFNYGTPASKATVVGDSSDGGKRLQLEGYVDIKSYSNFVIPYTFSADIISSVTDNYGIFKRCGSGRTCSKRKPEKSKCRANIQLL